MESLSLLKKAIEIVADNRDKKISVEEALGIFISIIDTLKEKDILKEREAELTLMTTVTALAQLVDEETLDKEISKFIDSHKNLWEEFLKDNLKNNLS